jgi:arylsulfatase A
MRRILSKEKYYLGIAVFILSQLISSCNPKEPGNTAKPNIVLIMADDLGYGELSCYGSTKIKTPNIDELAAQGVKFLDFHANGPVCSPTRAALMTGKYQQRTGVEGVITAANHREVGLSLDETTLAEELKMQGYTCGIFGKWHLGYAQEFNPTYQGFDEFVGFASGNIDYHSHVDQEGYLDWWNGTTINDEEGYTTDLITKYGVDFIKNNNPEKTGKPFFLYLPHESPHYPIQGRLDDPVRKEGSGKYIRKVPKDSVQMIYTDMIETLDEGIGDIMQALTDEGLDKNTMVIFCSDNGAAGKRGDNGVLRDSKGSVYEGGHRVPAIISYPGKIAGAVSTDPVMSIDFLPTLVDFAGGKPAVTRIDGISIKNLLLYGEKVPERDLFWSFGNKVAMRSGKWKLVSIQSQDETTAELFDLENDLSEKIDLSEKEPELVKEMLLKLENWKKDVRAGVTQISG